MNQEQGRADRRARGAADSRHQGLSRRSLVSPDWALDTAPAARRSTTRHRGRKTRCKTALVARVLLAVIVLSAACASTSSRGAASPAEPAPTPPTTTASVRSTPIQPPTASTAPTPVPSRAPATTERSPLPSPASAQPTAPPGDDPQPAAATVTSVTRTGAGWLVDHDLRSLHGRRVGLIAHRASVVDGQTLAAAIHEHPLVELGALFAPEHGLYGEADAGTAVVDVVDPVTGTPVYSLYGDQRAPSAASLADLDVLIYDLQDVGVRFYTYTSTLGLAMQAAAEAGIEFMVLDRPNPIGGDHLQGALLTPGRESFVGMYNVPSAYGLTSGELAILVESEQLLPGLSELELTVVPMQNWSRSMRWHDTGLDWIPPSPNLPTADAALVYPGTVLFEATSISEGRGTNEPFTLIGAAWIDADALAEDLNSRDLPGVFFEPVRFAPRSIPGAAVSPRFEGQELSGVRIRVADTERVAGVQVGLAVLDAALRQAEQGGRDVASIINRPDVFDRLAGTASVRQDLLAGVSVDEIRASFAPDHAAFADRWTSAQIYD